MGRALSWCLANSCASVARDFTAYAMLCGYESMPLRPTLLLPTLRVRAWKEF